MTHRSTRRFWAAYASLSPELRALADKQFDLLKADPRHPSLHFKKTGRVWSARVNRSIRALAVENGSDLVWFWIGDHQEYERLIREFAKS